MATRSVERPAGLIRTLSLGLAVVAPIVVVVTFMGSGRFIAAGAYLSLAALVISIQNWRGGDHSRSARIALIISAISLVLGVATLLLAIGMMGWESLWFMGSG